MSVLAAIRPDAWNLPLFVHVAGAMVLVAALIVVMVLGGVALRRGDGSVALTQLAFRGLLIGVFPAYIVMRGGAEWLAAEQDWGEPGWIGIGYGVADGGLLLAIIATVLAWRAAKRGDAGPGGMGRAVVVLAGILLVAYLIAIWAMTAKPD
jgi:hypothetical protein